MEKLIVVRHGHYARDDKLSDRGRAEMAALAEKLKLHLDGLAVVILTSTADLARQSAEILGDFFVVDVEAHEVLWSEEIHPEDFAGALKLVKSFEHMADVLVLVTHYEYVERFPAYFAREEWKVSRESHLIGNGHAWVLDCSEKTLVLVD